MIYKFRSPATGDVIMLGPHGDRMLALIGRSPSAKGIIEAAAMPAAISALEHAAQADEGAADAGASGASGADDAPKAAGDAAEVVALRARLWPMIEMLKRSLAAGEPVVWGV
ncbi:MAG: DUF1840 domain-containing protein [Rubrivivax sp.]